MIESLMTDLLAGAARGVADSFAKGGATSTVADQSFAKVFDSIQQNSQSSAKQQEAVARPVVKEKSEDRADDDRKLKADKPEKVEKTDRQDESEDDKPALSADAIAAKIMARLDKMKAENPDAYAALMENAGQMNMNDFLTELGFTADEIGQFADALNLNLAMPEEMVNGMAQGDLMQVAQSVSALMNKDAAAKVDNVKGNAELIRPAEKAEQVKAPVVEVKQSETKQETVAVKQESTTVRTDESRQQNNADTAKQEQGQQNNTATKEARPEGMVSSLNDTESRSAMKEAALETSKEAVAAKADKSATVTPVDQTNKGIDPQVAADKLSAPAAQAAQADKAAATVAAPKTAGAPPTVDATGNANASAKSDVASAEAAEKTERPNTQRRDFERMLMTQVVEKARIGFKANGASQMTMRLDPPRLGKIDVRIMVHENSMKAVMVAESPEVKAAIEGNLEQLKQQLVNAGMKVDELTVSTAADRQGLAFGQTQTDGRNGSQNAGSAKNGSTAAAAEAEEANATPLKDPRHNGLLSIVA